jgi:hypothetical protein
MSLSNKNDNMCPGRPGSGEKMDKIEQTLRRYKIWSQHLEKLCNAIGENELLYQPMPESNSAAWVLVHLIRHHREFVELSSPERSEELLCELDHPDEQKLAAMPLSRTSLLLQDYSRIFIDAVRQLDASAQLSAEVPAGEDKTWLDLVHMLIHQVVYHCGQLAYIARILQQKADKDGD